ncbi:uncharacterized protein C10orf95 homolog [Sorex araneus]|uniref:uncharacterized protein C10orf95 homolog n=1 Tax=Sorex araneus TaxID=42254 RepID=UPI002433AD47|nr:uncharacterized protein C10orf95 homolog [Sorex araneus]
MFSYSLASGEGVWPSLQPVTYTYLPAPWLLPPIQAHNFCSRPQGMTAGEPAAPREFHYFHGPAAAPSWWAFPQAYAAALRPPFPAAGYQGPAERPESVAPWPEGGSVQAELRWGCVERVLGPGLELPDFVLRELRRVYGTYPHTDARITYRGGEFLVQAAPRAREPEYRVERRVVHAPSGRGSRDSSPAAAAAAPAAGATERKPGRRKKRRSLLG